VTCIERNPYIFELLENGWNRGLKNEKIKAILERMEPICGDSSIYLENSDKSFDFVYVDPMFSPPRKAIKPKLPIQFLRGIVGREMDSELDKLIQIARKHCGKIVVKRSKNMQPTSFTSYTLMKEDTHYDVIVC
jgi:hypothetical protein